MERRHIYICIYPVKYAKNSLDNISIMEMFTKVNLKLWVKSDKSFAH